MHCNKNGLPAGAGGGAAAAVHGLLRLPPAARNARLLHHPRAQGGQSAWLGLHIVIIRGWEELSTALGTETPENLAAYQKGSKKIYIFLKQTLLCAWILDTDGL